jgi:GDP-L-fucose synthase
MVEARQAGLPEVSAWGSGNASREFLFVRDAAEAIVRATESYDRPEPLNLGSGREITIRELAELIAKLSGFGGTIRWDQSQPDGQPRRCLDTTRALREIGFQATTSLEAGLQETIDALASSLSDRRDAA